tara:strand:- start:1385 stop:1507 length:123 start_codon:yes stop_codon:yes gene_type:complete
VEVVVVLTIVPLLVLDHLVAVRVEMVVRVADQELDLTTQE